MLKKVYYLVTTLLSVVLFLSCSKIEDTTGLGTDIIKSINPTLVDFQSNILTFGDFATLSASSIPKENSTLFGIHTGSLSVGSHQNVIQSGYLEYVVPSQRLNATDSLISISFAFDTLLLDDTTKLKFKPKNTRIVLFACSDASKFSRTDTAPGLIAIDTMVFDASTTREYTATLSDSTLSDSIFKALKKYNDCIAQCKTDTTCKSKCIADSTTFRFCLFLVDSGIVHLRNDRTDKITPVMKITYKRDSVTIITDSSFTPSYTNYVAQDQNFGLSATPISSNATKRAAVFKIDLKPLWKTLDTNSRNLNEVLSAAFMIVPKNATNIETQDSTYYLRYYFSTETITNGNILGALMHSTRKFIADTIADTLVLPVEKEIQKFYKSRQDSAYLYIQLTDSDLAWKEVSWNNPKLTAVLTTLK